MGTGEPIRMGDKLYFFYSGRTYPHRPFYARGNPEIIPQQLVKSDVNIGLSTLRVDGFASLVNHFGGGTIETKPLIFDGKELHVNVDSQYGKLRVELLDHSGEPIPGFTADDCVPIHVDSINTCISWQEQVSLPTRAGKPVRLKFHLNNAQLYSFWID